MTTTVKQLIEYLKTIPKETEVRVICGYSYGNSEYTEEVNLNLDSLKGNVEYIDFCENQFVKENSHNYKKKYLILGEK